MAFHRLLELVDGIQFRDAWLSRQPLRASLSGLQATLSGNVLLLRTALSIRLRTAPGRFRL